MGEIKSTLDLVMEKTEDLTFSDEEKQQKKQEYISKKLNGLIGKYKDGALRFPEFQKEVKSLEADSGVDCSPLILEALGRHVDFTADNGPLLEILERHCGMPADSLKSAIEKYRRKALARADRRRQATLDLLKREHRISGSAVRANLENDEDLKTDLALLQEQFKNELAMS